jgi:hypothetical protein
MKATCEKAIAMLIIRGACSKRFSGLKKNLATDYGLKVDKYPDTIDGAINALNVAEGHLPFHLKKVKDRKDFTFAQTNRNLHVPVTNGKIMENIVCHKCKSLGHYANKCPIESSDADGKVSTHILCQAHQTSHDDHINHIQLTMSPGFLDKSLILLVSRSTVHVFNNKDLLTDIRMHPGRKTLQVFTNGGFLDSKMIGKFGNIDVWYNPNSIANILSLALTVDMYKVTFDSSIDHAFLLWLDGNACMRFTKKDCLFVYDSSTNGVPTIEPTNPETTLVHTVAENEQMYHCHDVEAAKVAQDMSKLLFHPTQSKLEKIVGGNFISNLPITIANVNRAE